MIKTYRGKISYLLPISFLSILFTVGIILDGELKNQSLVIFIFLLWIFFLLLLLTPLAYKLEVGNNYIRNSFFGFTIMKLYSDNIESINYGGVNLWGGIYAGKTIIHGKGLAILANIKGIRKTYGLSEKLYGSEAIEHVKSVFKS